MKMVEAFEGIYYLMGDIFPMQLIVTSRLSQEINLWLRELTNEIASASEVDTLVNEYSKHEQEELYKSVMNVIVRANGDKFEEAKNMCEALRELFEEEFEQKYADGLSEGIERGISQVICNMIEACKSLGGSREVVLGMVIEKFDITKDEAENYMQLYW